MFLRFRERNSDGRQPLCPDARIICERPARKHHGAMGHCPMRPRCRWRIGAGVTEDIWLVPYRLLVSLVETRRIDGKVRQECVADLGAIDGHLLPGFYAGLDPATVANICEDDWPARSECHRAGFWQSVDKRLARLGNRLAAEAEHAIRRALHDRVPRPAITDARGCCLRGPSRGI